MPYDHGGFIESIDSHWFSLCVVRANWNLSHTKIPWCKPCEKPPCPSLSIAHLRISLDIVNNNMYNKNVWLHRFTVQYSNIICEHYSLEGKNHSTSSCSAPSPLAAFLLAEINRQKCAVLWLSATVFTHLLFKCCSEFARVHPAIHTIPYCVNTIIVQRYLAIW